jgi:hypothetical protein
MMQLLRKELRAEREAAEKSADEMFKAWREEMAAWRERIAVETEAIKARTKAMREKMGVLCVHA